MEKAYFWNKKAVASYLLAVLVFWEHCSTFVNYNTENATVVFVSNLFQRGVNNIAVPMFFLLAGVTFYRDYSDAKYVKKMRARVYSLCIPFLAWNTINMGFEIVANLFFSQYFVGRKAMVFSAKNIFLGIFKFQYNKPFWFIYVLILLSVLAPQIDKLLATKKRAILSVLGFLILHYLDMGVPERYFMDRTCVIYYLAGGCIGRYYFDSFAKAAPRKTQLVCAGLFLMAIVYNLGLDYGLLQESYYVSVPLLIAVGLIFWNALDLLMTRVKRVPVMFTHSFWVYALHMNISAVLTKMLFMALPKRPEMCLVNFALTTVLTLSCIELGCFCLKKVTPKLYSLLSGSR